MTNKNYGLGVSGFLDPDLRNFETTVFQAGKTILDKELNLSEDIASGVQRSILARMAPSGWIADDFLSTSDSTSGIFTYSGTGGTQNLLTMPGPLYAHVNGWLLTIDNTNQNGGNSISLGAPPSVAGTQRVDLVILEVWRRLISASPDATGKSALGRIWRNGNVKVASANDAALNLADDIKDTNLGVESTKRVQVQYRLRVIQGVNIFTFPYGIDDTVVVANSVPASAAAPDGVATSFAFARQSANGDPGLWRAGDGNPANTIGSVDGYMYALPLMAVYRLNTAAFSRNSNQAGSAVAPPGATDRPEVSVGSDSVYPQIVTPRDVIDLRHGVSLRGWNYQEILSKNLHLLLDNSLQTEWETTTNGGGFSGHTVFTADEIGLLPGDGTTTGDTPGGTFIGQFDSVRRRFSDRPTYEVITVKKTPSGANWANSETITIDSTTISAYPSATVFSLAARAPSGTKVIDYLNIRHIGPGAGKKSIQAAVKSISGLGANPITIVLGTIPAGITNEPIYVDLLVAYPPGSGLSKTPTQWQGPVVNNAGALPGDYLALHTPTNAFNFAHREADIEYRTTDTVLTLSAEASVTTSIVRLPERARSVSAVTVNGTPDPFSLDTTGRVLSLTNPTVPGDEIIVTASFQRPIPQNGAQFTVYYNSRAPQPTRSAIIGTSITLLPRYISPNLLTIQTGSGSFDEGYPYGSGYVQIGGVYPNSLSVFNGDHELNGQGEVDLGDFNASTGMLSLPTYVPYTPSADQVVFNRSTSDIDIENRVFFPQASNGVNYDPSAYALSLSQPTTHRVALPMLAETTAASTLGPKGMLVLVIISRWAKFDNGNFVAFDPTATVNTTSASIFRVKGNLLNRRV